MTRQAMVVVRCRTRNCGSNVLGTLYSVNGATGPSGAVGLFVAARPMMTEWPLPEFEVPADYAGAVGMHVCQRHFMVREAGVPLVVGSPVSQHDRHLDRERATVREHSPADGPVTVAVQQQRWFEVPCADLRPHVERYLATGRAQSLLV